MSFVDKPQRVWWRKALFQVHLWLGIVLCLYVAVISVSGSILVFRMELERIAFRSVLLATGSRSGGSVPLDQMIDTVRRAYPARTVALAYLPRHEDENASIITTAGKDHALSYVYVSPTTGLIVGDVNPAKHWLYVVEQIHYFLLMGPSGLIVNGVGAGFLLLLTLTGIVLWWPGIRRWKRALGVKLGASWRRVNFDLHSAIGFWTLSLLFVWSLSSVYFAWPAMFSEAVGILSPARSAEPPRVLVEPPAAGQHPMPLGQLIRTGITAASPHGHFYGLFLPQTPHVPLTVLVARKEQGDFFHMDYVAMDPYRGSVLATWHRGVNPTMGSRFIIYLQLLHFGTEWGFAVKLIWSLLGLSMAALSVTGVLMYWNRYLSKQMRRLNRT